MYLSRVAAIDAGIPDTAPAMNVNRLCGSGAQAIVSVVQALAQTELAVETATTVRDKVVEAYNEILRMPV